MPVRLAEKAVAQDRPNLRDRGFLCGGPVDWTNVVRVAVIQVRSPAATLGLVVAASFSHDIRVGSYSGELRF